MLLPTVRATAGRGAPTYRLFVGHGFHLGAVSGAVLQPGCQKDLDESLGSLHLQECVDGLLVAFTRGVDDLIDGLGQGGGGAEVQGTVGDGFALELFVGLGMAHH